MGGFLEYLAQYIYPPMYLSRPKKTSSAEAVEVRVGSGGRPDSGQNGMSSSMSSKPLDALDAGAAGRCAGAEAGAWRLAGAGRRGALS